MAALRFFARSALSTSRLTPVSSNTWKIPFPINEQIQKRWFTVQEVPKETKHQLPEFEVSRDPKEWAFVERCLREKFIPKAPTDVFDLPSGWKPQNAAARTLPYLVERSKNHMQPVYLRIRERGLRKITYVRKIQGDIMALEQDMRKFVEKRIRRVVGTQINEPAGVIKFRGDHVSNCKRFLDSKGF